MGWWEDLSNTVSNAVDAAANVVQSVVDTAADGITDVVETVGNVVQTGLQGFGLGGAWLGGVVNGLTNLVGAVIKLVGGVISGVIGGAIRIVGGLVAWNGELIFKGILDIASGMAGSVLYLLAVFGSFIQKVVPVQKTERPLTKAEREMLGKVYFNSISLYNIRIVEGASWIFGGGVYATTIGNTIYMRDIIPDSGGGRLTLVHESVHIWQYQNIGPRYMTDALGAQYLLPHTDTVKLAYNWEVAEVGRGNTDWNAFNKEGQAEFIEDVWRLGKLTFNGNTTQGLGVFFDLQDVEARFGNGTAEFIYNGSIDYPQHNIANSVVPTDYTDIATEAVRSLRERINIRWSRSF